MGQHQASQHFHRRGPEGEEREQEIEKLFEEIMIEISLMCLDMLWFSYTNPNSGNLLLRHTSNNTKTHCSIIYLFKISETPQCPNRGYLLSYVHTYNGVLYSCEEE